MEIKTEFNIGQEVFVLVENKIQKIKITGIEVKVESSYSGEIDTDITYLYGREYRINETYCFESVNSLVEFMISYFENDQRSINI